MTHVYLVQFVSTGTYAGGGPKANLTKLGGKKKEKRTKSRKFTKNYHNAIYKWVKSEDFSRG